VRAESLEVHDDSMCRSSVHEGRVRRSTRIELAKSIAITEVLSHHAPAPVLWRAESGN